MSIIEFAHDSPGYQELVRLRDLHLRQPIGLRLEPGDLAGEEDQRHFALVVDGGIVGGVIVVPCGPGGAKLRQMWIDPGLRGQGHGRGLLAEVESRLAGEGTTTFVLHARKDAADFYRKSGYHMVGGTFIEVGLPHVLMEKRSDEQTAV